MKYSEVKQKLPVITVMRKRKAIHLAWLM